MVDPIFADPRLASVYDDLDADRSDLDVYASLVENLGARSVLDIGCGTGTFACLLASQELEVVGVDPAEASLAVARRKPGAGDVTWLFGDATTLPPLAVDLATMTGNVAQVFLTDHDWSKMLAGARDAIRPGGRFVFEVRDPRREAWRDWTRRQTHERVDLPDAGPIEHWVELTEVAGPLVSFRKTFRFERTDETITSDSTLRFRTRTEVEDSLVAAGMGVFDVRDAPDRPGLELVFVAERSDCVS